jgi:hypothetical protein
MSQEVKVVKSKLKFKGDHGSSLRTRYDRRFCWVYSEFNCFVSTLGKRKIEDEEVESRKESKPLVEENQSSEEIKICTGIGRISSSGSTVHGHGTDFMSQLNVNDAVIVTHPTT